MDVSDLFEFHDRESEHRLMKLPTCCRCGEHIQGDVYEVYFKEYCEDCFDEMRSEEWDEED